MLLRQVPLTDAERAEADARPEKLALGGAGGFQARSHTQCLLVTVRSAGCRCQNCISCGIWAVCETKLSIALLAGSTVHEVDV